MKLSGREAVSFFAKPDQNSAGILIFGADAMRVSLKRQQLIATLAGENVEQDMRLTRLSGADLRKDGALLADALKARGFFPGKRVVFLDGVGDWATKVVQSALSDWRDGDATLVVTAGILAARSSLRKYFEMDKRLHAAAIYTDPPSPDEIAATLAKAGISNASKDAMADLTALSRSLDPGDFSQTVEKLGIYMLSAEGGPGPADIAAVAPTTTDTELDDAINIVAEARFAEVGPIMQRLSGQGIAPVSVCIGAARHFRTLYKAASHPNGLEAGLTANRPPVFGPRRDRMVRQARALGPRKIENMLEILTDTDLKLRSSLPIPARAVLERALIRMAMLARS